MFDGMVRTDEGYAGWGHLLMGQGILSQCAKLHESDGGKVQVGEISPTLRGNQLKVERREDIWLIRRETCCIWC